MRVFTAFLWIKVLHCNNVCSKDYYCIAIVVNCYSYCTDYYCSKETPKENPKILKKINRLAKIIFSELICVKRFYWKDDLLQWLLVNGYYLLEHVLFFEEFI